MLSLCHAESIALPLMEIFQWKVCQTKIHEAVDSFEINSTSAEPSSHPESFAVVMVGTPFCRIKAESRVDDLQLA